jgi:tyrosinase
VWNATDGFGGDGDRYGDITLGNGRCVTDGPFKNINHIYFDRRILPHCLSRGFTHYETQDLGAISGFWFSPESMGRLKRTQDYDIFRDMMEKTSHNALHWGINGDFGTFSAANGMSYLFNRRVQLGQC